MPQLSVILFAYNEAESFRDVSFEFTTLLRALPITSELLVIDDGSTDGTGIHADALASKEPGVRVIHHHHNRGLGGVYRTGFAEARGELVTFFPADGQFAAAIIPSFLERIECADMVLGYLHDRPDGWWPKALSLCERLMYVLLFGRVPKFQGILMFRRTLLSGIELTSHGRGWGVLLEFVIKAARQGVRIVNVPTGCRPRLRGASKVTNARTIASNLAQVVALRLRT